MVTFAPLFRRDGFHAFGEITIGLAFDVFGNPKLPTGMARWHPGCRLRCRNLPIPTRALTIVIAGELGLSQADPSRVHQRSNENSQPLARGDARRLSKLPAVQTPDWASDDQTASNLIPFVLAGAWKATNETESARQL